MTRASWPSGTETATPPAAETAQRTPATAGAPGAGTTASSGTTASPGAATSSGATQPVSTLGSPGQPAHAGRPDRYFPVRLLVIIVIAALIGSALVLLLK